jgi:CDP-diacylglycerol--glycerol-3-phosphate 3-phosphatidyltransferase
VPYTRARGEALGIDMTVGLMQRPERVVILGLATAFGPAVDAWIYPSDSAAPVFLLTVAAIADHERLPLVLPDQGLA